MKKRRDFFLNNIHLPKAKWEVFNLTNLLIMKEFNDGRINRFQLQQKLRELNRTQGLTPDKSEMERLEERMFH